MADFEIDYPDWQTRQLKYMGTPIRYLGNDIFEDGAGNKYIYEWGNLKPYDTAVGLEDVNVKGVWTVAGIALILAIIGTAGFQTYKSYKEA